MERENLKEYIESKDYFKDARSWYNMKYMAPNTHKVWVFYGFLAVTLVFLSLLVNIQNLLPVKRKLTYAVSVVSDVSEGETRAQIYEMGEGEGAGAPYQFIATHLLKNYVIMREDFDYSKLKKQFNYVKKNSTRLIFKRFYNYMSVNNPDSPIMRYQQLAIRKININSIKFAEDGKALVKFASKAKDISGNEFEDLKWEAMIGFNMGEVGRKASTGSRFKFVVTDYKLKLLEGA